MLPVTAEQSVASPAALSAAAEIIDHMRREYGAKFTTQWAGVKADAQLEHWARRLSGYTPAEVRRGLQACSERPYPPTVPEFLVLCRPPIDSESAFHEAIAGMTARRRGELGQWSHPAIYWAAVRITEHDLLSNGYQVLRGRWENALRDWIGKGRWPEIPVPTAALPAPGSAVTSREEAARRLSDLGAGGIVRAAPSGTNLRWAKMILERETSGQGRPPIAVVNLARRALGLRTEGT